MSRRRPHGTPNATSTVGKVTVTFSSSVPSLPGLSWFTGGASTAALTYKPARRKR